MVELVLHLVWANMVFSKASVTGSTVCIIKVKQWPDTQYRVNSCITSATGSLFNKWGLESNHYKTGDTQPARMSEKAPTLSRKTVRLRAENSQMNPTEMLLLKKTIAGWTVQCSISLQLAHTFLMHFTCSTSNHSGGDGTWLWCLSIYQWEEIRETLLPYQK